MSAKGKKDPATTTTKAATKTTAATKTKAAAKTKAGTTTAPAAVPGAQPLEAPGQAAPGGWFSCNVTMTGPGENGNIFVRLREVNGRFDTWFLAAASVRKEILATALTAISASLRVSVYLTTTDQYGTVNRLFVVR
jgi:hypothetical protein